MTQAVGYERPRLSVKEVWQGEQGSEENSATMSSPLWLLRCLLAWGLLPNRFSAVEKLPCCVAIGGKVDRRSVVEYAAYYTYDVWHISGVAGTGIDPNSCGWAFSVMNNEHL